MKVTELIEELKKYPPNLHVVTKEKEITVSRIVMISRSDDEKEFKLIGKRVPLFDEVKEGVLLD